MATTLILSQDELDARLAAAGDSIRAEMAERHAAAIDAITATHESKVAQARADWVGIEAATLAGKLEAGLVDLRAALADCIEAVLRPFLVEAVLARATRELGDALDRFLADDRPIKVRGPADLIAALRAARPAPAIEWIETDSIEVSIVADATRIETRLAAALRALDAKES